MSRSPFSPSPPPEYGRVEGLDLDFHGTPLTSRSGWKVSVWSWLVPLSLYGSRWFVFPFWKGRSEFWISLCAILVYTEDDILVFGEVCDEVLGQEVFECLSSGVQDIAWIDLKHIQIKVVGICNVSMIGTRQF